MNVLDTTTETPAAACRRCGAENDRASGSGGGRPAPGDWSLCVECGELSVFTDTLDLREPTAQEQRAAAGDPDVSLFRTALAKVHGRFVAPSIRKQ